LFAVVYVGNASQKPQNWLTKNDKFFLVLTIYSTTIITVLDIS